MSKKGKGSRKKHKTNSSGKQELSSFPDHRAMEKVLADIGHVMEEQDFDSIEDANAFLQDTLSKGELSPSSDREYTPLEKAQDLIYEAWDCSGKRRSGIG